MTVLAPTLFGMEQHERTSDDYYTPEWVFQRMGIRFDLDVASPPGGIPWVPADRYFTMADDGLSQPWVGRVWMNPPYSQATPWVRRFIEHGNGVCLVPFAKSAWAWELWERAEATVMPPLQEFANGGSIRFPVWVAAFGAECVEAIGHLGRVR